MKILFCAHLLQKVVRVNPWKPGGRGIHRDTGNDKRFLSTSSLRTRRANKKAGGDVKKKGVKYEPYNYIPLKSLKKTNVSILREISFNINLSP